MNEELNRRLNGCLGSVDRIFSGHPSDAKAARDMLAWASENGVSMDDMEAELKAILSGASQSHIDKQVERLKLAETYL